MRIQLLAVAAFSAVTAAGCGGRNKAPPPVTPAPQSRPSPSPVVAPLKPAGEATVGDRTRCPTSDEEFVITADSPKVDYKGKTYYFCCSGCDQKFARDPEKYLGRLKGQGI